MGKNNSVKKYFKMYTNIRIGIVGISAVRVKKLGK